MANKDLFKQAIAEAKSVREAAIANAKDALEETLTPHLKDMLAAKLQEMEDHSEEELEETYHEGEEMEEVAHDEDEMMEAEDDSEESEDEAEEIESEDEAEEEGEAVDGDEELGDLSVDEFKDLIRDIIASELEGGEEAEELEMGADMDGGDIEGMGDEAPEMEEPIKPEDQGEEINLEELLAELEAEEEDHSIEDEGEVELEEGDYKKKKMEEEAIDEEKSELEAELNEAMETIEALRHELNEVNILNSKLLYVNRIFKANNLTEQQKVNIIAAFDKAETVKEVKLVYETVSDSVVNARKAQPVTEAKSAVRKAVLGGASKATGVTAKKPEVINEASDAVRRMQKLAGIIK